MDKNKREFLTNRLITGKTYVKVHNVQYCLNTPTPEIIYEANNLYENLIEENRFNNWVNQDYINRVMQYHNLWTPEHDNNLIAIDKRIDDLKVELYETLDAAEKEREKTRKILRMVQEKQHQMLSTKHMFDYMTVEGLAETAKNRFIIRNSLRVGGKRFRGDSIELQLILNELDAVKITVEELREIARTDPWRSFWTCSKHRALKVLGEEQRTLILLTNMYERTYKHPECPSEAVINDDDRFDGWMISEKRKSEAENAKKETKGTSNYDKRHKNANEVFIMAKNQNEANEIFNYNDLETKIIQRKRAAAIHQHGSVDEKDLPDVKQHLQIMGMEMQKQAMASRNKG